MSAISEYVHLRVANYIQYGTSRQGSKEPAMDSYIEQKAYMQARISSISTIEPAILNELKTRVKNESLQKTADSIVQTTTKYKTNVNKFLKKVSDILEQEIPKATQNQNYKMPELSQEVTSVRDLNKIGIYRDNMYDAINRINNSMVATKNDIDDIIENSKNFFKGQTQREKH